MAQAADVLNHFDVHIFKKAGIIQRVDAAGEDKILPDQDAVAVAQVVKALFFVEAAAPDPQHVLVRLGCSTDQPFQDSHP